MAAGTRGSSFDRICGRLIAIEPAGTSSTPLSRFPGRDRGGRLSLNITVATPKLVICATDRRLLNGDSGRIVTERSTKLTMLRCKNALSLVTYNGIGRYLGKTPSDWLLDLEGRIRLTSMNFKDVLEAIRREAEDRAARVPAKHRRHTFVLGAWGGGRTWLCVISNYESAAEIGASDVARPSFDISALPQAEGMETRVLVTGSTQRFDSADLKKIGSVAKKAGAAGVDIKNLCVQAVQRTAERGKRRGPVGSSVLWAIAERYKGVEAGLEVPGGTAVHELPNIIGPGGMMKDVRVEGSKSRTDAISLGKPFPLPEQSCPTCRNPVPLGYARCAICGEKII